MSGAVNRATAAIEASRIRQRFPEVRLTGTEEILILLVQREAISEADADRLRRLLTLRR